MLHKPRVLSLSALKKVCKLTPQCQHTHTHTYTYTQKKHTLRHVHTYTGGVSLPRCYEARFHSGSSGTDAGSQLALLPYSYAGELLQHAGRAGVCVCMMCVWS
jgi:hypothetical protein